MISEARLNKEINFKIELIDGLPTNKIVIVYSEANDRYYIAQENNEGEGLKLTRLSYIDDIIPIVINEESLLKDSSFKVYLLDSLKDIANLPNIEEF